MSQDNSVNNNNPPVFPNVNPYFNPYYQQFQGGYPTAFGPQNQFNGMYNGLQHGINYGMNHGMYQYIPLYLSELTEIKKNMEVLYSDFNKMKSLQELNNNNSVISNTFIDKTVEKFKLYDETNQEFLSQMKTVDARINSAFRKLERLKKNIDKVKEDEKTKNNKEEENQDEEDEDEITSRKTKKQKPTIKRRIIMSGPPPSIFPLMSMLGGIGGQGINFGMDKEKSTKNELIDSEDEYDMKSNIYLEPDLTKMEKDIIEVKLEIKSIQDLIDIGLKYKSLDEELNKKEKKEEKKEKISENFDNNIFKTNKGGLLIFNNPKKSQNDSDNDFSKLISEAFNKAILDSVNEANLENKKEKEKKEEKNEDPHYYEYQGKKYSVDINKLINLVEPLQKLQNVIGMNKIKENILEMILYYIQKFESTTSNMLHTSIEGPPGVGKTKLGRILAQIYYALGVIPSKRFKRVRRTDLVGKYLGHTAHKTQEVIDEAEGGVLFIDEAYSLGSGDNDKDIYSKECIDTINMNLTEKKKNLIVIIAGYTDQLDKSFFAVNEGLKRRFPFKFTIEGYNEKEMKDIFYAQIRRMKWFIDPEVSCEFLEEFFKKNKSDLPHFGGDIETILLNCKMAHAKRVLGKPYVYHKIINKEDILNAYDRFKQNKKKKEDISHLNMMYT